MRFRSLLVESGRALRSFWLIIGATVLLAVGLEVLYRVQGEVRRWFRKPDLVRVSPMANEPWYQFWVETDGEVNGPSRYDPYRAWWALPFATRWVNSDSLGRRVTVPLAAPGPVSRTIVMLGGSVMWGYTAPDSLTIPSMVAQQLRARGENVRVLNLAQPSYNATQGYITLSLALRDGFRPDAVVSLDGNNDALAALLDGHPGAAFGEKDLARRSTVGKRGVLANIVGLLRYSHLVQRLGRLRNDRASREDTTTASNCDSIVDYYAGIKRQTEGLGREFGFAVRYYWQPNWATTGKTLSPYEQALAAPPGFPSLMRRCTVLADSLMRARGDTSFSNLTAIYDGDTATVFTDEFGHLTPNGNQRIADSIVAWLEQLPKK